MHVYEVIHGIYKLISKISFFKTNSNGYFIKQQNETGYFYKMALMGKGMIRSFGQKSIPMYSKFKKLVSY